MCSVWPIKRPVKQRIDQDRAVAVVPVEGQQPALAGLEPLGLPGEVGMGVPFGEVLLWGPGGWRTS